MTPFQFFSLALTSPFLVACATATTAERQQLVERPIVCDRADQDIASLEAASPSKAERGRKLLQSVTPPGVMIGLVTGQYQDRRHRLDVSRNQRQNPFNTDDMQLDPGDS